MKRRFWLSIVVLFSIVGWIAPVSAQTAPIAAPVREFQVTNGRFIGLSPDGRMYAVAILDTSLCVYDTETLVERNCGSLAALHSGIRLEDVVWSPDSTKIAFAENAFRVGNDGDLWVMDAQSGAVTDVTDDGFGGSIFSADGATFFVDVAPAWTPDSQFITFSRSGWVKGEPTGNVLAQVPAAGGEVETLATVSTAEPGVAYFGAGWAPDGRTFYFTVTHVDSDNPENGIWTYDPASGATALLAAVGDQELGPLALLQVSPAGDRLLAWYPQAFSQSQVEANLLRLVDVSSGELTVPADPPTLDTRMVGRTNATFSPDGTALLLLVQPGQPASELWVTDLTTGTQTMLLDTLDEPSIAMGRTPSWGSNGAVGVGHYAEGGYLTAISGIGLGATPISRLVPATDRGSGIGIR